MSHLARWCEFWTDKHERYRTRIAELERELAAERERTRVLRDQLADDVNWLLGQGQPGYASELYHRHNTALDNTALAATEPPAHANPKQHAKE